MSAARETTDLPTIVVTTVGSWGDVFPLVPVATELRNRGHDVTFACAEGLRDLIEGEGFQFSLIRAPWSLTEQAEDPRIVSPRMRGLVAARTLMREWFLPHLDQAFEDLSSACRGADLLISHPGMLAAPLVAESHDLLWATATVFPGFIPSVYTVPQGSWQPALPGAVGRAANRLSWAIPRAIFARMFDRDINLARQRLGLGPVREAFPLGGLSRKLTLVLSSPSYTPRQPDWHASIAVTGFTYWDTPAQWQEPPELEEFLRRDSFLVATLGASLSVLDPRDTFDAIAAAADELGLQSMFLVGNEANRRGALRDRAGVWPHVPLSRVLPHAMAMIHHGGFGTTAASLINGVPSLVLPRAHDQIFHAERLAAERLGRALSMRKQTARGIRSELSRLLDDHRYAENAHAMAARSREERGVDRACEKIEHLIREAP